MVDALPIVIPTNQIHEFCRRNHIRRLALFGSVLRDGFGPESDIDMLVEFFPDRIPGLISLARMQTDLSEMIGRNVDLRTPNELSRYFRDEVVATARPIHDA